MLIQQIARTTQHTEEKLLYLANSADRRYKVYQIDKRNGGKRTIEHPSRELKALQRWIIKVIVDRFPVHYSATAYRKGCGVRENAERHRTSTFTNRYDFARFFPSFVQGKVEEFFRIEVEKLGIRLDEADIRFIGNIVCRNNRLTIGAPSSPAITNAMMYAFDQALFRHCETKNLIYTRYADDLFISSKRPGQLENLESIIVSTKKEIPHLSLRLNRQKTAYLSKKHTRRITGVVITPDHKLSIGRLRKREIKSLIHRWKNGDLVGNQAHYMRGLVAFARDIEPAFEHALRTKYGSDIVNEILRHPDLGLSTDPEFLKNLILPNEDEPKNLILDTTPKM